MALTPSSPGLVSPAPVAIDIGAIKMDPMCPTECSPTLPKMDPKRPDKYLMRNKFDALRQGVGALQLASGEQVRHLNGHHAEEVDSWKKNFSL